MKSQTWLEHRDEFLNPVKEEREALEKYYKEEKMRLAILWNERLKEAAETWKNKKRVTPEVREIVEIELEKFVSDTAVS